MTDADDPKQRSLSYRDAGVDIDAGNRLVDRIRPVAAATHRPGVMAGLGGFGALFELPPGYREPVLVASNDGVGTKVRLAAAWGRYDTVGVDLVAMCANDVICQGAEPLFFLDYYAAGHLDVDVATRVIEGIGRGCEAAGAALIGGETAEMPGLYQPGDFDLAGFCVGVVEKDAIIDGRTIAPGDALIGLASAGPHANGFSLIRRILETASAGPDDPLGETTLADALLAPTRIYVKPILALCAAVEVRGLAHITGGGLVDNVARIVPDGLQAALDAERWARPPVFEWLARMGRVETSEMWRTFNGGIGMVACVPAAAATAAIDVVTRDGERAWVIGEIVQRATGAPPVSIHGDL